MAAVHRTVAIATALTIAAFAFARAGRDARADGSAAADAANDTVAFLPLDADASLELYGQPVASELARALVAGKIEVVVVGRKVAMPATAKLIVDGTIATGAGGVVHIALRIRNPRTGKVLDTLTADAATLETLDRAAAELSTRVVPAVHTQLEALRPKPAADHVAPAHAPTTANATHDAAPAAVTAPYLLATAGTPAPEFQTALGAAIETWSRRAGREPTRISIDTLTPGFAAATVVQHHVDAALAFDIVAFSIDRGTIPIGHATVRVRIADSTGIAFDRVVVTDSVVGNRGMDDAAMTARIAEAVVEIVAPHVRRKVPAWLAR